MILKRFYDDRLAHASWLVGCTEKKVAAVIDPNRDAEQYRRAAADEGLRITHVIETHVHADYISGTRELAALTGARPHLSDEGDAACRYRWPEDDGVVLLHDGDRIDVGRVRMDVAHAPGHTPEHVILIATDTAGADAPMGVFTGDFVFVGDVGRPDLMERADEIAGSPAGNTGGGTGGGADGATDGAMEDAARRLFASLQSFQELPGWVQIWPAHGAGSACGKALGAVPQSTVGYEKRFNPAFQQEHEDAFVRWVLSGQPEPPKYFAEMKRRNRVGPAVLGRFRAPPRLPPQRLEDLLASDALVVDARGADAFADGHVPGTISIPLDRSFDTWAGSLVPYDRDVHLLLDDAACADCAEDAARALALIGHDRLVGWFGADTIGTWAERNELRKAAEVTPESLERALRDDDVMVIDVRSRTEWERGHLPGVVPDGAGYRRHIPLGDLTDRLETLPADRRIVLHCLSGARSAIGASVLRAHGFDDVANLRGGYARWTREGRAVERPDAAHVG
jgi:hydroxyacylglutathione hydrolase